MTDTNKDNYFQKLMKLKGKVEKKLGANYISWADAWAKLKEVHPYATFKVHENESGMPYFADETGAFVKVSVTIPGDTVITHTSLLPIFSDKSEGSIRHPCIKKESLTVMDINKSIQRALAKAIALHGVGLYVYQGEDLPEDSKDVKSTLVEAAKVEDTPDLAEKPQEAQDKPEEKKGELHMVCIGCGKNVTEKVFKYSMDKHKMSLCFVCQKKKEKGEDYLQAKEEELEEEVVM